MKRKWISAGIVVGVLLALSVTALAAASTIRANGAMRLSLPDLDTLALSASVSSEMPELGKITIKGLIEQINVDSYVVGGLTFKFDTQTHIDANLLVGDPVEVVAKMMADKTLLALSIERIDSDELVSGTSFEFEGAVESMDNAAGWVISGVTVTVDPNTVIDSAITVGSQVDVKGLVVAGVLIASEIELEGVDEDEDSEDLEVEFSGTIESMTEGQFVIDGKTVLTNTETEIEGPLAVGDLVKVHALLQTDGTYLASEIEKEDKQDDQGEDEDTSKEIEITGKVESFSGDVLVVAGYTIMIGEDVEIDGELQVGSQVKVEAILQADGTTYLAEEIEVVDAEDAEDQDQDEDQDDDEDEDDDEEDDLEDEEEDNETGGSEHSSTFFVS